MTTDILGVSASKSEYRKLIKAIINLVNNQLKHGFGEINVVFEIGKGKKRHVIIKHGMSYKYVISEDEIDTLGQIS